MAIFALIGTKPAARLAEVLGEKFSDRHLSVAPNVWLVAANGSVREISDELEVTTGASGSVIIFQVSAYWGRADPNIWTWIKENWESTSRG
jgi:hypothetical protein